MDREGELFAKFNAGQLTRAEQSEFEAVIVARAARVRALRPDPLVMPAEEPNSASDLPAETTVCPTCRHRIIIRPCIRCMAVEHAEESAAAQTDFYEPAPFLSEESR